MTIQQQFFPWAVQREQKLGLIAPKIIWSFPKLEKMRVEFVEPKPVSKVIMMLSLQYLFLKNPKIRSNILENVVMFAFASSKCNCFCNHVKERSSWAEPYWGCLILLQVRKIYLDFSIWGNSAIVQALKTFFLFHHVTILAISQLVWFSWISLLNLSLNLQ